MADQFDVSVTQRQNLLEKAKRRAVLREEFLKQSTDPRRHGKGEGGTVFDPAIQRFSAMRVSSYEHFKPTLKTSRIGLLYLAFPLFGVAYLLKTTRDAQEEKYRTGQVAYKDRNFKFI